MEQSSADGDVAAKCPHLSPSGADAGQDRISTLPDDILVLILLPLGTVAEAVRTSVLSHRWRRVWTLLPELTFRQAPDVRHVREVLVAADAPALRQIRVFTKDDAPDDVAAWLPHAARRLSGTFLYHNSMEGQGGDEEQMHGVIPLPYFVKATAIDLDLGFLALALPSSGAFTRLTELCLERIRFQGTCELGGIISSPRCPSLRKLRMRHARGLARFVVHSESLLQMDLWFLNGFQQLKIDAPSLKELALHRCFMQNQPIAHISAPVLVSLHWRDAYDPSSVQLGNLGQLQQLGTYYWMVYGQHGDWRNRDLLRLLQRFQFIHTLFLALIYPQAESTCPSGCICDQPPDWKTQELSLNCLEQVTIICLEGAEHELDFLKQLLKCAGVLKKLKITFDYSVSKGKAKEFCQRLSNFSRPETCAQFQLYHNSDRRSVDSLSLEDEGTGL